MGATPQLSLILIVAEVRPTAFGVRLAAGVPGSLALGRLRSLAFKRPKAPEGQSPRNSGQTRQVFYVTNRSSRKV